MRVLKNLAMFLLAALLVPSLILLIAGITLGGTVFSPSYFDSVFDRSFSGNSIETLASGVTSGSGSSSEAMSALLRSKEGSAWIKSELPGALKGSYRYFASGSGKLPVVDIKQLKEAMLNVYADKASEQTGVGASLLKQFIKSQLDVDSMKDKLDLNALVENAYAAKDNPVTGFGPMLAGVRANLFLIILSITVILLALIAVIAFRAEDTLRWAGVPAVIAGVVCLVPAAAALLFQGALKAGIAQAFSLGSDMAVVRDWLLAFANGAALYLLVAGAVAAALGVVMLTLAGHVGGGRGGNPHTAVRVVAGLVLLAAVPLSLYVFGKATWTSVEKYDNTIKAADSVKHKVPFGQALDKTLNSKVFAKLLK